MQTASEGGRRGLKAPASRPETKAFGRRSHAVGGGRAPKPALGEARAAPTGAASRRLPPFRRRVPQRPPDRAGSALRPRTGRRPEAPQSQIYGLGEALPCPRGPGDTKQKTDGSGANSHLRSTPAPRVCGAARDRAAGAEVWSPRAVRPEPHADASSRIRAPGRGLGRDATLARSRPPRPASSPPHPGQQRGRSPRAPAGPAGPELRTPVPPSGGPGPDWGSYVPPALARLPNSGVCIGAESRSAPRGARVGSAGEGRAQPPLRPAGEPVSRRRALPGRSLLRRAGSPGARSAPPGTDPAAPHP